MNRLVVGLFAVLSLLSGSRTADAATVQQVVDRVVSRHTGKFVGICIGAQDGPDLAWSCGGETVLGNHQVPNARTLFGIASITKTVTGTGLALAMQSHPGLLNTDVHDLAREYEAFVPAGVMTVKELADQMSGLPHMWPLGFMTVNTVDANFIEFGECLYNRSAPHCWSGVGPSYSNGGYAMLGAIVADELGHTNNWFAAMYDRVLTPLGMKQTGIPKSYFPGYFDAHTAIGYSLGADDGLLHANPAGEDDLDPGMSPGGSLWSSPTDMNIWLQYNMGVLGFTQQDLWDARNVLYKHYSSCFTAGQTGVCYPGFTGLAWESFKTPSGETMISKSGGLLTGFHSFIGWIPSTNKGVWVMVNSDGPSAQTIGQEVLDLLP